MWTQSPRMTGPYCQGRMTGKEQKQKRVFTRDSWLILKPHFNKNTMKKRNPYLRLCLPSDMQKTWLQSLFFLLKMVLMFIKKHKETSA